jgi:hypothetical protein
MSEWPLIDSEFLDFVETDDALFHYTKRATARDILLPTKKLRLSQRQDTNDPWEYKFRLLNAVGHFSPGTEGFYNEVHPHIDRVLRHECRVVSFCSNHRPELILTNEDRVDDPHALLEGWNKPRMWAQYGENHNGACLVFSKRALEAQIANLHLEAGSFTIGYVLYTQENRMPFEAFTIDADRLSQVGCERYATEFVRTRMDDIFYLKHIDYRDEAEYRVVIHDAAATNEFIEVADSLKGVLWGDRTTDNELRDLHPQCTVRNVGCGFVHWDRGTSNLLHCSNKGET